MFFLIPLIFAVGGVAACVKGAGRREDSDDRDSEGETSSGTNYGSRYKSPAFDTPSFLDRYKSSDWKAPKFEIQDFPKFTPWKPPATDFSTSEWKPLEIPDFRETKPKFDFSNFANRKIEKMTYGTVDADDSGIAGFRRSALYDDIKITPLKGIVEPAPLFYRSNFKSAYESILGEPIYDAYGKEKARLHGSTIVNKYGMTEGFVQRDTVLDNYGLYRGFLSSSPLPTLK